MGICLADDEKINADEIPIIRGIGLSMADYLGDRML